MREKIVTLGAYQMGALDALKSVVNLPPFLEYLPRLDVENLFYSYMLQSGARRLELAQIEGYGLPESEFLRDRISFFPADKYEATQDVITAAFPRALPAAFESKEEFREISRVKHFLIDLCFAMQRKRSMVSILGLPHVAEMEKTVSPELYFALKNLFSMIKPEQASVPSPRSVIAEENVRILLEILASDLFAGYSTGHAELDSTLVPESTALRQISNRGKQLLQRNADYLHLKTVTISLLPVTAKVVDTVFGKLPGAVAEHFAKLATTLMNDQRRIVIYNFRPMFDEILTSRIEAMSQ